MAEPSPYQKEDSFPFPFIFAQTHSSNSDSSSLIFKLVFSFRFVLRFNCSNSNSCSLRFKLVLHFSFVEIETRAFNLSFRFVQYSTSTSFNLQSSFKIQSRLVFDLIQVCKILKGRIENLESENEFLRSQAATAKEQKAHPEKI
ncbi:myosin-12 [Trifolium repens]|nr:myosin-12 [Trifolium repens]